MSVQSLQLIYSLLFYISPFSSLRKKVKRKLAVKFGKT
jgi:hypothetical protein